MYEGLLYHSLQNKINYDNEMNSYPLKHASQLLNNVNPQKISTKFYTSNKIINV